jgi:hypothetical protein
MRSIAFAVKQYVTAQSADIASSFLAKVHPIQQPLPKTNWEPLLEHLQKPILVPSILLYLTLFISLNLVVSGYIMWDIVEFVIKAWFSGCKLA